MKTSVIERVREFADLMSFSETELANCIGMSQRTVNNYMNGSRKVSYEFIETLVRTFELDANWLITGKGNMYKTNTAGRDNNIVDGDNNGILGSGNTVGNIGGSHVSITGSDNIKKIMKDGETTIEMQQPTDVESLQQVNSGLHTRIKDLEATIASQSKTIETMQLLIDTYTKK